MPSGLDDRVKHGKLEQEGQILHSFLDRNIVRINEGLVRKSGPNIHVHEPLTLQFIAENTSIPVPKVHEICWEDGKAVAFVMDYIPGETLEHAWGSLKQQQKLAVARQLRGYVSQLRSLKGNHIGALGDGPAIIGKHMRLEGGPFASEQLFNRFILEDIVSQAPNLLRHCASFALEEGHEIVFTHGDLNPRNIIVDSEGRVAGILDWEYSGWYPEYWEYTSALHLLKPVPDWPEYLPTILPQGYEKEYIGMTFLGLLLRH